MYFDDRAFQQLADSIGRRNFANCQRHHPEIQQCKYSELDPLYRSLYRSYKQKWYLTTGNGFPAHLYSVFKLMWYRVHEPDLFTAIDKFLGTKDYINFKLTGELVSAYSYDSGCGAYDLKAWNYCPDLVDASGIPSRLFPEIFPSTQIIGRLTPETAEAFGLPPSVGPSWGWTWHTHGPI